MFAQTGKRVKIHNLNAKAISQPGEASKAKPFVKWVGGKTSIAAEIIKHLPDRIENYYEPFVGGGAIFFRVHSRIQAAFLSDVNSELMQTYKIIQNNVEELIEILEEHRKQHNKAYYYKLRGEHKLDKPTEIAARFIYLNKTCYNGLYRVNSRNQFNVPIGSYTQPKIVDHDTLRNCSMTLQGISLTTDSFEDIEIQKNAVIYCDPPYDETYNQYSSSKFEQNMQERLRDMSLEWAGRGAKVIISNADTEYIRGLYAQKAFTIITLQAPRYVSCKTRGTIQELLITTRET